MQYSDGFSAAFMGSPFAGMPPSFFFALVAWSLVWKGLALWHASKRGEQWWFVALLVINTAGILDIIYLFFFARKKFSELFPIGKIE